MSEFIQDERKKEEKHPSKQNRTGIPTQLKQRMEQTSGFSFDDVRVHYNSDRPKKLDALAYTQGTEVYLGPGQERHLPHELGHVVQQKQGIVRPNERHESGILMNTDRALERQADEIGAGKRIAGWGRKLYHIIQRCGRGQGQAQAPNNHNWGNPRTLQDHFSRHGGDVNAANAQDYARIANEFYNNRNNYQVRTDTDGTERVYDATTGRFGSYNADGTTRTFFVPTGGQQYFNRQPGAQSGQQRPQGQQQPQGQP